MHKMILQDATEEQLRKFITDALSMIRETSFETYKTLENYLYKEVYGCHFNKWLLEEALNCLENEDETKGGHWKVEQTTYLAKQNGITFDKFNEFDFNYVMNMMYSDYFGAVPNESDAYLKLAKKFLMDKDAPEGKAYKYYVAMRVC